MFVLNKHTKHSTYTTTKKNTKERKHSLVLNSPITDLVKSRLYNVLRFYVLVQRPSRAHRQTIRDHSLFIYFAKLYTTLIFCIPKKYTKYKSTSFYATPPPLHSNLNTCAVSKK
jgi:hypothetical protein